MLSSRNNPFEGFALDDLGVAVNESTRMFMVRVYLWMTLGIFISGVVAFKTAANPAAAEFIESGCGPLVLVSIVAYFLFDTILDQMSPLVAGVMFIAYSVLNGLLLSSVFYFFELGSIFPAFFITAGAFVALSLYATFTERDLTPLAGLIVMGIFGVLATGLLNLAVRSPRLEFSTSVATVLIASAITAVTTQHFRAYYETHKAESPASLSIRAAFSLYLSFVNFFVAMVRLTGRKRA